MAEESNGNARLRAIAQGRDMDGIKIKIRIKSKPAPTAKRFAANRSGADTAVAALLFAAEWLTISWSEAEG